MPESFTPSLLAWTLLFSYGSMRGDEYCGGWEGGRYPFACKNILMQSPLLHDLPASFERFTRLFICEGSLAERSFANVECELDH